jgi:glycosyltransferase involved in cell wall biosynthesis
MLAAAGTEVALVVPESWPGAGLESPLEPGIEVVRLPVRRSGDVNRHGYVRSGELTRIIERLQPDVLDVHEEPFSVAAHQVCSLAPAGLPIAMYTAQNVDKRYPPPFAGYELKSYSRASAFYPCSRQAAAVVRGKGFGGVIEVLPLGFDPELFEPGDQELGAADVVLTMVGRLVPEKGVLDAVHVLHRVNSTRPAQLLIVGEGPLGSEALTLAGRLGVDDRVELRPWQPADELARIYRSTHVVLVPSRATPMWAEQFGRVIVEAQASGAVVAGFASGAIPEVGGAPALLVDEGDTDALGRAVASLLGPDGSDWEERRRAGIELSSTRTWACVASRQLELYRTIVSKRPARQKLPEGGRARRSLARAEFGPTASTPAGDRPFALPLLRHGGRISQLLGRGIDAISDR